MNEDIRPLIVDLDYTLIKSDVTVESLIKNIKQNPVQILIVLFLFFSSKAALKRYLAERIDLEIEHLPYNQKVLDYIKREKAKKRKVYLVSASDQKYVDQVANHLKLFDAQYGSDGTINLKGAIKLQFIKKILDGQSFDYIGDSKSDTYIWDHAETAIMVNHKYLKRYANNADVLECDKKPNFIKVLRVHQWSKNILIFIPILTSHRFNEVDVLLQTMVGFISFSLIASSGYLFNDTMDVEADRRHPDKKKRQIPSGVMSLHNSIFLFIGLFTLSLSIALTLSTSFTALLLLYFSLTCSYSIYFKKFLLVDILFLAFFYCIRIFIGANLGDITLSKWLLLFSMFFFMGLAFLKRYIELIASQHKGNEKVKGRGYQPSDSRIVQSLGVSAGLVSVQVFCLYLSADEISNLYTNVFWLWFLAPLIIYYLSRLWILAERQELLHDPVEYTLKDRASYLLLFISVLLIGLAFYD
jgi:4-hydroxybenzoate polyprenyltransferase/phosphoserine phosphatase